MSFETRRAMTIAFLIALPLTVLWLRSGRAEARPGPPAAVVASGHRLKIRVWERSGTAPTVVVNVPTALVSAAVTLASRSGALDWAIASAAASAESADCPALRIRGAQLATLWRQLASAGPAELVQVHGSNGDRVEIKIE
jgi:hypothetical protein